MKYRFLTAALAAFLMLPLFGLAVYAEETPPPEGLPAESIVEPASEPTPESEPEPAPDPFTPPGTGTVVDNATDEDGKEFYTITTADGNVFYLIIDRQREGENVYFLNGVTEEDLMALAGESLEDVSPAPPPEPAPTPTDVPEPEPEPQQPEQGGNTAMIVLVIVAVLGAGGAAFYFKILRPKQRSKIENEYDEDEYDGDGAPPWDTGGDADTWEDSGEDEEAALDIEPGDEDGEGK